MALQMAKDFAQENAKRDAKLETIRMDSEVDDPKPIFSMNLVIYESVPRLDTLDGGKLHAADIGNWTSRWDKKPQHLIEANKPWLIQANFFEDHITMLEVAKMRIVADRMFVKDSLTEANRALPLLAKSMNWTSMRHNELIVLFDVHEIPSDFQQRTGLSDTELDELRVVNIELLAAGRAPQESMKQYLSLKSADIAPSAVMVGGFITAHWRQDHEAWNSILNVPITEHLPSRWVNAAMNIAGYQFKYKNDKGWSVFETSHLPGVAPLVMVKGDEKPVGFDENELGHTRFLSFSYDMQNYTVYSYSPAQEFMTCDYFEEQAHSHSKQISLPTFNSTILTYASQPLSFGMRKAVHKRVEFEDLLQCDDN
eukprot:CAMPEP_0197522542 /NCGR_PEP_ID=MMETSP1318-20131121/7670_1 /TAXON_ID=552666 /ORGANISM="Partenskyella glossopodia, Strain RCC365" /LENGTH=367 /DNA_ID=CAMNT_0043074955 /DNA_START=92 /DNA_END=1195 /DNA_ORIENTATION=+